jgi:hypothetical protein
VCDAAAQTPQCEKASPSPIVRLKSGREWARLGRDLGRRNLAAGDAPDAASAKERAIKKLAIRPEDQKGLIAVRH